MTIKVKIEDIEKALLNHDYTIKEIDYHGETVFIDIYSPYILVNTNIEVSNLAICVCFRDGFESDKRPYIQNPKLVKRFKKIVYKEYLNKTYNEYKDIQAEYKKLKSDRNEVKRKLKEIK